MLYSTVHVMCLVLVKLPICWLIMLMNYLDFVARCNRTALIEKQLLGFIFCENESDEFENKKCKKEQVLTAPPPTCLNRLFVEDTTNEL